jgi:hypothetical protein
MIRPLFTLALVLLAGSACRTERAPQQVDDQTGVLRPVITTTPVNNGTYGMIAQVRWMLSPDRSGIAVVVDAVGVEAESVPDGFVFARENPTFLLQVDSVWDVVPRPDWRAVAYSRAHVVGYGESEVIAPAQWEAVSRVTGLDTATLRTSSFSTTGMAYARGIAQPVVVMVPEDPRAGESAQTAQPRVYPIARGWRLRWVGDGSVLALGSNPRMVQDDSPSESWTALDPATGAVTGSLPGGTRLVEPRWEAGPDVGIGMPVNTTDAPPITVRSGGMNYIVESQRGIVTIRDPAYATHAPVAVGTGVALAATASGRYVVALRPRQEPREHESPVEVVVYTLTF